MCNCANKKTVRALNKLATIDAPDNKKVNKDAFLKSVRVKKSAIDNDKIITK